MSVTRNTTNLTPPAAPTFQLVFIEVYGLDRMSRSNDFIVSCFRAVHNAQPSVGVQWTSKTIDGLLSRATEVLTREPEAQQREQHTAQCQRIEDALFAIVRNCLATLQTNQRSLRDLKWLIRFLRTFRRVQRETHLERFGTPATLALLMECTAAVKNLGTLKRRKLLRVIEELLSAMKVTDTLCSAQTQQQVLLCLDTVIEQYAAMGLKAKKGCTDSHVNPFIMLAPLIEKMLIWYVAQCVHIAHKLNSF